VAVIIVGGLFQRYVLVGYSIKLDDTRPKKKKETSEERYVGYHFKNRPWSSLNRRRKVADYIENGSRYT
jgi:hypothetical protein